MNIYEDILNRYLDDRDAYLHDKISEGMANGKQVSLFAKGFKCGQAKYQNAWLYIFELYDWYWSDTNSDIRNTKYVLRYVYRDLGFDYKYRSHLISMIRYVKKNDPYKDPEIKEWINGGAYGLLKSSSLCHIQVSE